MSITTSAAPPPRAPRPKAAWTASILIGLSIVVALVGALVPAAGSILGPPRSEPLTIAVGELWGPRVRMGEWWRLLSFAVVHGGPIHLGMNMLAAYQFGFAVERRLGTAKFAQITLISCLASASAVLVIAPEVPVVGASGIIFGWMGLLVPLLDRRALGGFAQIILLNVFISFLPHVSWQGHLGGFLGGLACGALIRFAPQRFGTLAPVLVGVFGVVGIVAVYR